MTRVEWLVEFTSSPQGVGEDSMQKGQESQSQVEPVSGANS